MAGLTALQLMVPDLDPLLDQLRPVLPAGSSVMDPAHISLGYPWLELETARAVIDDVAAALAHESPFDVVMSGPRRFEPDADGRVLVWLEPQPVAAVHALSWVISDASDHDLEDFTPHCSIVRMQDGVDPTPLERLVQPHLPVTARLHHLELRVQDGDDWVVERTLTLGSARP